MIISIAVTSITLFFSRIRDRMVRGETWSNWQKWMSGTLPNQDRIFSLLADGTGPLFVSQLLCRTTFIFWYGTYREYGVPPPQHAYCKKKKKHPRGTLPGGLILVGFTIIYSVVGFIHPSIHPTIHPSSQRDIHPIPSHPIHSIHSIHPSIPIPVWNVQGG